MKNATYFRFDCPLDTMIVVYFIFFDLLLIYACAVPPMSLTLYISSRARIYVYAYTKYDQATQSDTTANQMISCINVNRKCWTRLRRFDSASCERKVVYSIDLYLHRNSAFRRLYYHARRHTHTRARARTHTHTHTLDELTDVFTASLLAISFYHLFFYFPRVTIRLYRGNFQERRQWLVTIEIAKLLLALQFRTWCRCRSNRTRHPL